MTIQDFFQFILEHRVFVLAMMFLAPWVSYLLCIMIPGTDEEPFILNLNLTLAVICLGGEMGYLIYTSHLGGLQKIVEESEFLFLLAPIYYVGVSLWVTRQRLPLNRLPVFRIFQGLGMVCASYLLLSWLVSKIRIVLFSYLPFGFLILSVILLLSVGYLGYLKLLGRRISKNTSDKAHSKPAQASLDREFEELRRKHRRDT